MAAALDLLDLVLRVHEEWRGWWPFMVGGGAWESALESVGEWRIYIKINGGGGLRGMVGGGGDFKDEVGVKSAR